VDPIVTATVEYKQMQDMGLKLSAEDIYSINHSSLKDAVVSLAEDVPLRLFLRRTDADQSPLRTWINSTVKHSGARLPG